MFDSGNNNMCYSYKSVVGLLHSLRLSPAARIVILMLVSQHPPFHACCIIYHFVAMCVMSLVMHWSEEV